MFLVGVMTRCCRCYACDEFVNVSSVGVNKKLRDCVELIRVSLVSSDSVVISDPLTGDVVS